jgi:drug/metabolite transporter (DMT)-like permease
MGLSHRILIALMQVSSGALLLPLAGMRGLREAMARGQKLYLILAGASCAYFFGSLYVLEGLAHSTVTFVSNIRSCEPFFTATIMVLVAGKKLDNLQIVGLVFAVGGVFLSSMDPSNFEGVSSSVFSLGKNLRVMLLANLFYSVRNILLSEGKDAANGLSELIVFGASCVLAVPVAGIALLATYAVNWKSEPALGQLRPDPAMLLISVSSFVLYNLASFLVLVRVRPITHGVLLTGKRVSTVLLACVFLHQIPNWMGFTGIFVTVAGVALYDYSKRQRAAQAKQMVARPPHPASVIATLLASNVRLAFFVCSFTFLSVLVSVVGSTSDSHAH